MQHKPKNISLWLLLGWLALSVADQFLARPHSPVYLCDPATLTGAILISLAISAATTAAQVGLQAIQAGKQKRPPAIDRGKLDDVRVSTAGYNEFIVKGWGKFRSAPVWIGEARRTAA